ncbi:response regulator transcription factor [Streptacidiphilus sp. P02-A3a]|nr:response regulator transcription factor [Streptacidiphilus sp. P02-A3a]
MLAALLREAGQLVSRLEVLVHAAGPEPSGKGSQERGTSEIIEHPEKGVPEKGVPEWSAPALARLTQRETRVMELLLLGLSNRQIARRMVIAEPTVKNHLHSIFGKLGVTDRTQAVTRVLRG